MEFRPATPAEQAGGPGRCPAVNWDGYQCERPLHTDNPHRALIGATDEQGPIPEVLWHEHAELHPSTPTTPRR
jgi:hypothetical protein